MSETPESAAPSECLADIQDVAALYAAQSGRVRRLVCLDVQAPETLIEDACQVAWMRLVRHRARVRRESASRWLLRVAVNEARRQLSRGAMVVSLDELREQGEQGIGAPLPAPGRVDELAERREALRAIRELPVRQRRLVWLQTLGFSYAEMAGATGETRRTVERQLLRAKHALAEAHG